MNTTIIFSIFSVVSALLGVLIAWIALSRDKKKDSQEEGKSQGYLASDIGYIKAGVDDLKREMRETRHEIGELSTRVARCEESCKQAHHRIDEIHHLEKN